MRRSQKLLIGIAALAAAFILPCVFTLFLWQKPFVVLETPKILTVNDGSPGSAHVKWIVISKVKFDPPLSGVGILLSGKIEIKQPGRPVTSLPLVGTNTVDLLTLLNPPPAELPPIYKDSIKLLVQKTPRAHDLERQRCQIRITLKAIGGPPSPWRRVGEVLGRMGIWNPSSGLPLDDLLNRLTRVKDDYPVSSKWSQPGFKEYNAGDSL